MTTWAVARPARPPAEMAAGRIIPARDHVEYLGVGYIIGPRVAGTIFAGGVLSWLVLMPAIKFFGQLAPGPVYPSTVPIPDMTPPPTLGQLHPADGAGAVAAAGLITLMKTMPTILAALRADAKDIRAQSGGSAWPPAASSANLPMSWSVPRSLVMWP